MNIRRGSPSSRRKTATGFWHCKEQVSNALGVDWKRLRIPGAKVNGMSSKSVKTTKWEWATWERVLPMLGAGLMALIVVSGSISAHGQQDPRNAPPAQVGAPAQAFSPAAPAGPASIEAAPQPAAPPSATAVPPGAPRQSETSSPAAAAPAAAERATDVLPAAEQMAPAASPRDLPPYGIFMSADI